MTVTAQTPLNRYTANGATTVFAFSFLLLQAADLVVQVVDATGAVATKALGTDYTVSGLGVAAGGTVTFTTAPANGYGVIIFRASQIARSTDYQNNGDFLAATVNADFDRLWLTLQEVFSGGQAPASTVRAPIGEVLPALPSAASRASTMLGFDSSGNPSVLVPATGTAADVLTQLANSADAAKGDAQLAVKRTASGAAATTQHVVNEERWVYPKADFAAAGDGTTDDTAKITAIAAAFPGALIYGGTRNFKINGAANAVVLPAGWRMLEGAITDGRTVTTQDNYSVLALGWNSLQANTFIPEQWSASGGRYFASGNHIVALGGEALKANTTGRRNVAVGSRTQLQVTTGYYNTAIGSHSMEGGTTAYENTMVGVQTGQSLTTGAGNTAVGLTALGRISTGTYNTALGWGAGSVNTVLANINGGSYNCWIGYRAGYVYETGQDNTAVGRDTLVSLTTGQANTVVGSTSMGNLVTGGSNTTIGYNVANLYTGSQLTAGGYQSLAALVSGIQCTGWGYQSGNAATGANGTFVGFRAGYLVTSGTGHTHVGSTTGATITTGSNCTMLGYATDGTAGGDNQTSVGYGATCTGSNQVTLGNNSVAALRCQVALTVLSDMRDKVRVADIPGLSFVERIEPFIGRWSKRDGSENPTDTFAFFSAQNLQGAQQAEGVNLGIVSDIDPDRLEVTAERLIPVLVQAIKDLAAQNRALLARVAALEAT